MFHMSRTMNHFEKLDTRLQKTNLDFKHTSIHLTALIMTGKLMDYTGISSQYNYIMNIYKIILHPKKCISFTLVIKTFTIF